MTAINLTKLHQMAKRAPPTSKGWRDRSTIEGLILESWGQGLLVGSLMIMAFITIAAMRRHVLLHKLILLEQLLAMFSGTYCFMAFTGYGWYVSSTAALLYSSYFLHNVVAWMKVRPFFVSQQPFFDPRVGILVQRTYYISLSLTIPVLIFQTVNDYRFNEGTSSLYSGVRPYEFVMRDPWWIFTNIMLLHVIGRTYGISILSLIRISPRLGILLTAIMLSISFTIIDLVATVLKGKISGPVDGINPYWKLSLVFKCLTDAIMLDDFATELKRIGDSNKISSGSIKYDHTQEKFDTRGPSSIEFTGDRTWLDQSPERTKQSANVQHPKQAYHPSMARGTFQEIEQV